MNKILDKETDQALQDALARYDALLRVTRNLADVDNLKAVLQSIADVAVTAVGAGLITIHSFDLLRRKVELMVRSGPGVSDPQLSETGLAGSPSWTLADWRPNASG